MKVEEFRSNLEKISWGYSVLLACCVFRVSESVQAGQEERLCCGSPSDESSQTDCIGLFFTGPDGVLTRRRLHYHDPSLLAKKSKATRDRIVSFVLESVRVQDFLVVYVISRLRPAFVDELSSYSSRRGVDDTSCQYNVLINDLVNDLLPADLGERVDASSSSSFNAIPHVVYLEPRLSLVKEPLVDARDSDVTLLRRLGAQLGVQPGWLVPAKIVDDYLFSGAGVGNRESSFVVVNASARERGYLKGDWENPYLIPWLPLALLNHASIMAITQYCSSMFQSHVLLSKSYSSLSEAWGSFTAYRTQYLGMRLAVEQHLITTEELIPLLEAQLPTALLYEDKYFVHFTDQIRFGDTNIEKTKTSLPFFLKRQRQDADDRLSKAITSLRSRIAILDEFLCDSGVADATHANLRLAKSVQSLTWAVTAISVLAFVLALIPDAMKLSLLSRVVQKPALEWLLEAKK